jgi:hypothetical protein
VIFGQFLDHFPYFGMRGEQDAQDLEPLGREAERQVPLALVGAAAVATGAGDFLVKSLFPRGVQADPRGRLRLRRKKFHKLAVTDGGLAALSPYENLRRDFNPDQVRDHLPGLGIGPVGGIRERRERDAAHDHNRRRQRLDRAER